MASPRPNAPNPHQSSLMFAAGLAVASFMFPVLSWATVPLQYLNTHLHELCHALASALTGGYVDRINVFRDGSGVTLTAGGSLLAVAPAGYCGSALIGALMIYFSRTARGARAVMQVLAVVLASSMVFWVRGDVIGVIAGFFWIALLVFLSRRLQDKHALFAVHFLGATQCLASLQAFHTLLSVSAFRMGIDSDAQNMANASGIPAIFWAVLWFVFSVVLMVWTLRSAWRPRPS